jgi:hypothetical protein
MEKYPVYETEMLWDVCKGIYKRTIYFSDGTFEEQLIPKGPVILPSFIGWNI